VVASGEVEGVAREALFLLILEGQKTGRQVASLVRLATILSEGAYMIGLGVQEGMRSGIQD
jgi:hypothetical protein